MQICGQKLGLVAVRKLPLVSDLDVARMSFMAFHFMLDLMSRMNDKDKQQVYGCMVILECIECGNMTLAITLAGVSQ